VNLCVAAFHFITLGENEKIADMCKSGRITVAMASATITLTSPDEWFLSCLEE
jgi:hypothetical protein